MVSTALLRVSFLLICFYGLLCNAAFAQLDSPRLATAIDGQQVSLNWTSVVGAAGYRFYFAPYPYTGPNSVESIDMGAQLTLQGELPEDSSYYVAVEAYVDSASSALSNIEYFVINNAFIPFSSSAGSARGLTLIAPMASSMTFLIDDFGAVKNQWQNNSNPRLSAYLLPNGHLLRTGEMPTGYFDSGGKGGVIEELDWNGNAVWSFNYSDQAKTLHHDIEALPNGNVLALSWEDRGTIWSEVIVEIEKTGSDNGKIVWRWDVFDHLLALGLDPSTSNSKDWLHLNSIDYNHATNQILVSSRSKNQLWIINKESGEIAAISSVELTGQHDAQWIGNNAQSNITVFDNGNNFSRALELNSKMDTIVFSYGNSASEFFFSNRISGVQRLANGNTQICVGIGGLIIEVDSAGNKVREYQNVLGGQLPAGPSTDLFRAEKYPTNFTPFF